MKLLKLLLLFNFITLIGQNEDLIGNWSGELSTEEGEIYGFDLELFEDENELKGVFVWEILRPSEIMDDDKIGLVGIEHVKVYRESNSRIINFSRIKKEDPNNMINSDAYFSCYLYENGQVLQGINAKDALNNNIFYGKKHVEAKDKALTGQRCLEMNASFLKGFWSGPFSDYSSKKSRFYQLIMEVDSIDNNKFEGYIYNINSEKGIRGVYQGSKHRKRYSLKWIYSSPGGQYLSYGSKVGLEIEGELIDDKIYIRIPDIVSDGNDTMIYEGIYIASILDCNTISGFFKLNDDVDSDLTASNRFLLQKFKPETSNKSNVKLIIKDEDTVSASRIKVKLLSDEKGDNDIVTLKLNGGTILKNFRVPLTGYKFLVPLIDGVNILELDDDDVPFQEKRMILSIENTEIERVILNSNVGRSEGIRINKLYE